MANYNDIVGQDHIKAHLQKALELNKVSHAYIIEGEKYSGKKFISKIFAASLLCSGEGEVPCGKCQSCIQALSDNNPDIIKLTHEKPSVISVGEIRRQINDNIHINPYYGKRKIYIIDEAEKMNEQAQNALLKTFEEPPEYAVIMLLVTNIGELLPTIQSRAVKLTMYPVKDSMVKKYLMEKAHVPDYKADMCASFARGNLGKALLLSENADFEQTITDVTGILKQIKKRDVIEINEYIKQVSKYKDSYEEVFDIMLTWFRDICFYKSTGNKDTLIFKDDIQYIKEAASESDYEAIQKVISMIDISKRRIASNVNFELTMELLFLTIQEM